MACCEVFLVCTELDKLRSGLIICDKLLKAKADVRCYDIIEQGNWLSDCLLIVLDTAINVITSDSDS